MTGLRKKSGVAEKTRLAKVSKLCFETGRLTVHPLNDALKTEKMPARLHEAFAGLLTPDVLKHLPPALSLTDGEDAIERWIDARTQESVCFLINHRTEDVILGLMILVFDTEPARVPGIQLGYPFLQSVWGQGYATELVTGLLGACRSLGPIRIHGGVSKGNPASARVLSKLGFVPQPELASDETEVFSITIDAY